MHTEIYCSTLDQLSPVDAIRAVHQAYLQLKALSDHVDCEHFDNRPALDALAACLRTAGHLGFQEGGVAPAPTFDAAYHLSEVIGCADEYKEMPMVSLRRRLFSAVERARAAMRESVGTR